MPSRHDRPLMAPLPLCGEAGLCLGTLASLTTGRAGRWHSWHSWHFCRAWTQQAARVLLALSGTDYIKNSFQDINSSGEWIGGQQWVPKRRGRGRRHWQKSWDTGRQKNACRRRAGVEGLWALSPGTHPNTNLWRGRLLASRGPACEGSQCVLGDGGGCSSTSPHCSRGAGKSCPCYSRPGGVCTSRGTRSTENPPPLLRGGECPGSSL